MSVGYYGTALHCRFCGALSSEHDVMEHRLYDETAVLLRVGDRVASEWLEFSRGVLKVRAPAPGGPLRLLESWCCLTCHREQWAEIELDDGVIRAVSLVPLDWAEAERLHWVSEVIADNYHVFDGAHVLEGFWDRILEQLRRSTPPHPRRCTGLHFHRASDHHDVGSVTFGYFAAELLCRFCGALSDDSADTDMQHELCERPGTVSRVGDRVRTEPHELGRSFFEVRARALGEPLRLLQPWVCPTCRRVQWAEVELDDGVVSSIAAVQLDWTEAQRLHWVSGTLGYDYEIYRDGQVVEGSWARILERL